MIFSILLLILWLVLRLVGDDEVGGVKWEGGEESHIRLFTVGMHNLSLKLTCPNFLYKQKLSVPMSLLLCSYAPHSTGFDLSKPHTSLSTAKSSYPRQPIEYPLTPTLLRTRCYANKTILVILFFQITTLHSWFRFVVQPHPLYFTS